MEADWGELFFPKVIAEDKKVNVEAARQAFAECGRKLQAALPPGRYKSMVKTQLEQAAAMATKAFTHEGL